MNTERARQRKILQKRFSRKDSHAVSKPLNSRKTGVERPLAILRRINSPEKARTWLGHSLADVGREIARLTGRPRPYDKAAVWHWEQGGVMADEVRQAYGTMVANKLTAQLGRVVGVKLVTNSPWVLTAWTKCKDCGGWFELKKRNQKRCDNCISHD